MCATAPVAPRLPPCLVNTARTAPPVRLRLLERASTMIATPPGPIALVADRLVGLGVGARGLLDGTLDVVLGHVLGAGGLDGEAQARVHLGVGQAVPDRDRDLARQLGEQLGAGRVLAALAVHDVLELRMAGHARISCGKPIFCQNRLIGGPAGQIQIGGSAAPEFLGTPAAPPSCRTARMSQFDYRAPPSKPPRFRACMLQPTPNAGSGP